MYRSLEDFLAAQPGLGRSTGQLLDHEIHHRGQLAVLMRQAGLVVPGVFGPAQEEWTQYGMEPPAY